MQMVVFCLKGEDALDPLKRGLKYAKAHQSEWISLSDDVREQFMEYDWGMTHMVIDDITYTVYKDYVLVAENKRLYILTDNLSSVDKLT